MAVTWLKPGLWLLLLALFSAIPLGLQTWTARLIERGDAAGYARAQAEATAAALKARAQAEAQTATLQIAADAARRSQNAALTTLARAHAELADGLRDRPQRPASAPNLPTPASAGPTAGGCSGAQLYRADGEFLAGEAARADTLAIHLRACRAAYDQARQVMPVGDTTAGP